MKLHSKETELALSRFGKSSTPREWINAIAIVKKSYFQATYANSELFSEAEYASILEIFDDIINGKFDKKFSLDLRSSVDSLHANICEVITELSIDHLGKEFHAYYDFSRYQDSTLVLNITARILQWKKFKIIEKKIIEIHDLLNKLKESASNLIMNGRISLQSDFTCSSDSIFESYISLLDRDRWRINRIFDILKHIPLGLPINHNKTRIPKDFIGELEQRLRKNTNIPLCKAKNYLDSTVHHDELIEIASVLSTLASNVVKVNNDLLHYSSSERKELVLKDATTNDLFFLQDKHIDLLEYSIGLAYSVDTDLQKISKYHQAGQLQSNSFFSFIMHTLLHMLDESYLMLYAESELLKIIKINKIRVEENYLKSSALITALKNILGRDAAEKLSLDIKRNPLLGWSDLELRLENDFNIANDEFEQWKKDICH